MRSLIQLLGATALFIAKTRADESIVHDGQLATPGLVIVNAPQPKTPLGGDTLHISLDVTANGHLPLNLEDDSPTRIHNISIFLSSYSLGNNFTVTNGTAGRDEASLGNILEQEPGSTVKHVNWVWPDCLVGDGGSDGDRGNYNISIRQYFRLNDEDHYTIYDLPIAVTNGIPEDDDRPSCESLMNELLSPEEIDAEDANKVGFFLDPDSDIELDYDELEDESSMLALSWVMLGAVFVLAIA
ncbi:uncharacterized protein F5Z01DRAFT_160789 [Emericellopsis atlantica]|uniref:Uncharacterized protein n=1 Tax=Emericellopsis atlantica TaxID=2614577 RepID=A0A9P7ZKC7_9HYPO|nr:uncharacterized protein F5Z01DRAFT_160789 [Emericellopsis atlantica]KAG9253277.1 hypothetical protein F5Z01DRAFT_160789 [Emericellopsis atlantica]